MKGSIKRFIVAFLCIVFTAGRIYSQSTQLTITPQNPTYCAPGSATMTANLPAAFTGTAVTLPDDGYTPIIPIGFNFTYFGTVYNQCLISSNNYITFDLTNAGGFSPWFIPAAIPTPSDPINAIMCPWQDLLPPAGGTITYATLGTAPNRVFVVAYCSVAMFSCTTLQFTSQIQLHETTNYIETHIASKPVCPTWNGGNAIHGIQNAAGTIAFVVPGRNWPTQWTTALEGYRFTPTGPNTYAQGLIPYAPIILSATTGPIQWFVGATLVGTGPTLTVSPTTTTTYTATVTGGCIGTSTAYDTVHVVTISCEAGNNVSACSGSAVSLVGTTTSTNTPTYTWTPAATLNNPNIPNPVAHTTTNTSYILTVNDAGGCVATDTVNVTIMTIAASAGVADTVCVSGGSTTLHGTTTSLATPITWAWTPAATLTGANTANPVASPTTTTTYTLTVTDANGCIATSTVTIVVAPPITLTMSSTPVLCNGGSTGTATVAVAGGYPALTYSWNPGVGSSTSSYNNLPIGTYTVTVRDRRGCVKTATVTITQPPVLAVTSTHVNVTCNAACNGTATVTPTGGTGAYTYSWTPSGGTAATASALCAGTYTCTIHDANNCVVTDVVTITQPTVLAETFTQVNVTCNAACNGTATVTPTGGTGAYTYSWTPSGGTAATASALCAGTYTCTVHDANNCVVTQVVTITQPAVLAVTSTQTNVTCNAACNGTATVTPTGGTGAYTYSWTPSGGTAATASALCAGTYTCTIHDANNCVITKVVTITQPVVLAETFTQTNVTCNAGCNGTSTVTPTGGTAPYTYAWTPSGGTAATASALCAGTYTCTVHDANNCVVTQVVTITQPAALAVTFTQVNVTCNAACNGSATVTVTGGTGAYTYAWTPSGGTAATASALCAGTYTCTIHDANNCVITQVVTITQPAVLAETFTQVNVTCNAACTGSATVTPTGGTGTYTYSWTPSGGTAATASALCAGTYTCTVHDANNCVVNQVVTITQPAAIVLTTTDVPSTCGNANGSATVTATGGTGAYTYAWTPSGGTAATASGLTAGTYTVTVHDANGCIKTATVVVPNTGGPSVTIPTSVNVSCFGGNNGSATASVTGGTAPYTYSWTPTGGTGITGTGLSAGTYTVTVHDANGCLTSATITITQPALLTATISASTNVSCNGGTNGSATVTAGGGTGAYTYSWTPTGGTAATASGYSAGTYTITVHDANGCVASTTVTITQPPVLAATNTQVNELCNGGNTGSGTVTATGGTGTYTYSWSPSGGTGATASGLTIGTYTCTIHDANGCVTTSTLTITQPTAIALTTTAVPSTCGNPNGSATVTATGGTGAYTYAWTPSGGTAATAPGLTAGTYTVTVHDANGCVQTTTVVVPNTGGPSVTIPTSVNVSCFGGNNGSATASVTGGTAPYTYSWTPTGGTGITGTGLSAGTYTVTIHDANGCLTSATITITQPALLTAAISASTNVSCNGGANGSATVTAGGGTGAYTYAWTPTGGTAATASGFSAGTYTITVHDANGCVASTTVTITQPPLLAATNTQVNELCNGGNTGSATVTATGGTGAYTYSWSPSGGTAATASGLTIGTYTCTIHDANGCVTTSTVTITQPTAVVLTATAVPSTCGNPNGSATVTATGGTGAYTYAWAPSGGTAATAPGLTAGTYTVTVHDANGCVQTATIVVPNTGGPSVTIPTSVNVSCFGGNNGSATASVTGGTSPYTYSWTPTGGTGITGTGLSAGTYTVTIHDANGCMTSATITITQPTLLTAAISASTNVSCNGGANGSATVTAGGGTGAYTYAWTPIGGTAATASGLSAGTYTATVHDANGCVITTTVTITQPPLLTATNTFVNELCNGGNTGSGTVTATGGTGAYTYSWSPSGGAGATASGLTIGTYTCTITDANGCTTTSTVTITQPTAVALTTSAVPSTCGNPNGTATVTATGGTGTYTYAWSPSGGTAATATGLIAGTYTVTVHDANGCVQTATIIVPNTGGPTVTIASSVNVSCFGGNNGSATSSVTGGTAPYTYSWTPSGGTGATGTALTAGTYTITVTDHNGCVTSATVTITQPPVLAVTIPSSVNVSCFGGNNGSATSAPTGGTLPYTYSWTPSGGTGVTGTALIAGTYTITVTDAQGCTATASIVITEPTQLAATNSQTNVNCNGGANGTATVVATGATPAYTYSWSPAPGGGQGTANATGLLAGTYTCTITDHNGCSITSTVTITQPTPLAATSTSVNSTCGNPNGSAIATITGGTGPYTYSWNPGGQTTATATALLAGTYTCHVTDANGCIISTVTTVIDAGTPTAVITASTNVSCFSGNNGSASVNASGGTPGYSYTWSPAPGVGQGTANVSGLTAQTYTVTVHDVNGCAATTTVTITQPPVLVVTIPSSINVSCFGGNNGSAVSNVSGGTSPYVYSWTPSGGTGSTGTALIAGTYTVTVTDAHGCIASATIVITQPTQLAATNSHTNVSCNAGNDGTATVVPTGATPAYTYSWSPAPGGGQGTANATGLIAGTYVCTVTDSNGCFITSTVTITQPPALVLSLTSIASHCNQPDGTASVTVTGGTGVDTYTWSPAPTAGQGTGTAFGFTPGTVTVTVHDANNCVAVGTIVIQNVPGVVAANITTVNVSCFSGNDGKDSVHASAGAPPYTYSWSPAPGGGQGTPVATGLIAGNYSCQVTDSAGCTSTVNITITQPALLVVTVPTTINVSCFGGNNGSATSAVTGGTAPYTYSWTPAGGIGSTGTALSAGTYTVTVTDSHGCIASTTVIITQPTQLAATNTQTNVSCNGGNNGTATVIPTGATPTYSYNWAPAPGGGQGTATATGLIAGTYVCTITDHNGCSITSSVTITQPPALALTMSSISAHCNQADGTGIVAVTGGTGAYTYSWSPAPTTGQGTTHAFGFIPGTVTVTVTDSNHCVATGTLVIQNVPGVTATNASIVNVSCFGGNDGKDSIHATAGAPPYTYLWAPAPGGGQGTAVATGLTAGAYSCVVTDSAGCTSTVNINIAQPALLTVTPMGPLTLCISNCTPLIATGGGGTGPYNYTWTVNTIPVSSPACPVVTTTYTVICSDAHGCVSAPAYVTITVNRPLEIAANGTASLCPGGSTTLTSLPSGGDALWSYSWIPGTGLNNASAQNPIATPGSTTTYTVIVTDGCGTPADSATVTVTIFPTPVPVLTAPDTAGCAPLTITFNGSSNPGCASASWLFGDGGTATGCGAQTHTYVNAGSYTVTMHMTDINGCPATIVKPNWITVFPVPEAAFTASPQPTTILNSDITFTNHSTGGVTYVWNFGDLANASSTLMSPHYVYPDTGCFTVTLIAKNTFGCTDTAHSPICITPDFSFYAPNAFTPNGDGLNDIWTPQGVGVDPNNYHLYMFDRWGNMIWSTSTWGQGWDGRANNGSDPAQIDTYVWKVVLKDFHGKDHSFTGSCSTVK